ncbi:BgTH12-05942, partial [Blumeria graminis f. sp. triticale]
LHSHRLSRDINKILFYSIELPLSLAFFDQLQYGDALLNIQMVSLGSARSENLRFWRYKSLSK